MDRIDELLLQWYEYSQSYKPKLHYGGADPACRDFRTSRQWMDYDDLDAEVEWDLKSTVGKILDPMIQNLEIRHRIAINTAIRNFQAGYTGWVNPRYPETQEQDYERSKAILCPKMVVEGLLEKSACKPESFSVSSRDMATSHA